MADSVICTYEEVTNIAAAIRTKTGSTDTMYVRDMAGAIENMNIGSSKISLQEAIVTLAQSDFVYDGTEKTQEVSSVVLNGETLEYGVDYVVIDNVGTTAGAHTLTVFGILDYDGAISISWNIAKKAITKPTLSGSYTYSGSAQNVTVNNFNTTYCNKEGTTSATNAGTYSVTFSLKDTNNTEWADGTTAEFSLSWTIAKANGSISANPSTVEIGEIGGTAVSTLTYAGDGAISVTSGNTSIATVSRSGNKVTITAVAEGDTAISVKIAEGTNHKAEDCSIAVSVTAVSVDSVLGNNDWDVVLQVAQEGTGENYWSVGDRIGVPISGTVGLASLSGTYYAYILGFNHNSAIEGGGIHFQFGFTAASGGVHVAFCDSSYGSSGSGAMFHMNSSNTNSGGWANSYMRNTICSQFLSALPTALQNVIASTTKYTDNTGGGSNTASYVTATSDKIFLLAECEIFGKSYGYSGDGYANDAEKNYQEQYEYYVNGNSKVMYKSTDTSTACYWWQRSPYSSNSRNFCIVGTGGNANYYGAYRSFGFAPGFRVG